MGRERDRDQDRGRDNKKRARRTRFSVQRQNVLEAGQELETRGPTMTGIRNKNNRECKGCKYTFNTRKAFFEHCMMVHEAKLKKKGELGVPPTQGPEEPDGAPEPSTKPGNQKEEAKHTRSPGVQRYDIDELLVDSSREEENLANMTQVEGQTLGVPAIAVIRTRPKGRTERKKNSQGRIT